MDHLIEKKYLKYELDVNDVEYMENDVEHTVYQYTYVNNLGDDGYDSFTIAFQIQEPMLDDCSTIDFSLFGPLGLPQPKANKTFEIRKFDDVDHIMKVEWPKYLRLCKREIHHLINFQSDNEDHKRIEYRAQSFKRFNLSKFIRETEVFQETEEHCQDPDYWSPF
jgi:hypothetical protein